MFSRTLIESFGNRPAATVRFITAVLTLALVGTGWRGAAIAAQPGAALEHLTDSLVKLHGRHLKTRASSRDESAAGLQNLAAARHQLLAAAMEADPGAVLQVALPASFRRGFPAALRRYVEEEVDLDGNLEVLHEDRAHGSRLLYQLESHGEEYALHFKTEPPAHLASGGRVRVRGVRVNHAIALQSSNASVQALNTIAPNTLGDQRTIVILVNFRNQPVQPYDLNYATQLILNATSDFFLENSYRQTYLSGVVKGWYTVDMDDPTSDATCNYSQISALADQAATNAGVVLSNYRRKIYAFPQSGCGWWGLGTIGGNPSRAWINGSLQLRVAAHELGHNMGLYHSHSLDCSQGAVDGACAASEYGDTLDTMGATAYHFNAFQKERLGWLNYGASPPITTVEGRGSYRIDSFETVSGGSKAVKILRSNNLSTGRGSYFYAECRRPLGFDSALSSNANVRDGFVIRSAMESDGNSSYLLDMSPAEASDNWYEPALMVGYSFTDPVSGVTITPEAPCGDAASGSIAVSFGSSACLQASPDIAISPNTVQWLLPGGSATYVISLTNNDSSGCGASYFGIAPVIRSGWSATLENSIVTLAPGASGQISVTVTSPVDTADGFYSFSATASRTGNFFSSTTVTTGVLVITSLIVDVTTNKPVYNRGRTSIITATVTAAGAPVANATVSLTINLPDGGTAIVSAATKPNGVATFKLRINRRDPLGDWQIQAGTTMGGCSVSAATTFTVK